MEMRKFTVLAKGEVVGDYRAYIVVDEQGRAFQVYRCNWGRWPEFAVGDLIGILWLHDRLAWDAAGFDANRVHEMPMPTAQLLAETQQLRSQSNNVCMA